MSLAAADSGDIHRYTPEEVDNFHNDNVESSELQLPSITPSIPRSFRGTFVMVPPEKLQRVLVASAKGFSIGAGIKGGLALFAILARFARKKPPRWGKKKVETRRSVYWFAVAKIDFVFARFVQEGDCVDERWSDCFGFEGNFEIWFVSWNLRWNVCFNGWAYSCSRRSP